MGVGIFPTGQYGIAMTTNEEIGRRVRESLGVMTQAALAEAVDMTADAMSRALRGQRGFSSIELAEIAAVLRLDVHWLITGERDPMQVLIAARHDFNHETGKHSNLGRSADQQDLDAVELAYRQVFSPVASETDDLPRDPGAIRERLGGEGFIRTFADRVEENLGIDVIRLPLLSTAYSLTIGGRRVVVLPTAANWFRSNSDLAHEVAHLALRHHDAGTHDLDNEPPANAFAAELLLPSAMMRQYSWADMTGAEVARFLWDAGVSGAYVGVRLNTLGLRPSDEGRIVLTAKMPGALRPYMEALGEPLLQHRGPFSVPFDPIDERMKVSAQRRFPAALIAAHRQAVEGKLVNPAALAWMLDCGVSELFEGLDPSAEPGTGVFTAQDGDAFRALDVDSHTQDVDVVDDFSDFGR